MILPKNCSATEWLQKMDKLINYECPAEGEVFDDIDGRILVVNEIDVGNRLGHEVQGKISAQNDYEEKDYSCTLSTWAAIWRDKSPRQDPSKMVC